MIHEKISKLDGSLKSGEVSSDAKKKKALIISEKLRADAIRNGLILFSKKDFQIDIHRLLKDNQGNKYNNLQVFLL